MEQGFLNQELQAALLKLDSFSAEAAMRARAQVFVWRIIAAAGWATALAGMVWR